MKNKTLFYLACGFSVLSTASVSAENVHSTLGFSTTAFDNVNFSQVHYARYFEPLTSMGPRDYFGFNNRNNSLHASVLTDDLNFHLRGNAHIAGQFNTGQWRLSGSLNKYYDDDYSSDLGYGVGADYFISSDWSVGINGRDTGSEYDDGFEIASVNTRYKQTLKNGDTLGYTLSYLDYAEQFLLGLDYFRSMDNGQYIKANVTIGDGFDFIGHAAYYFSEETAIEIGFTNEEFRAISMSSFFYDNLRISGGIQKSDDDWDVIGVSVTAYY